MDKKEKDCCPTKILGNAKPTGSVLVDKANDGFIVRTNWPFSHKEDTFVCTDIDQVNQKIKQYFEKLGR